MMLQPGTNEVEMIQDIMTVNVLGNGKHFKEQAHQLQEQLSHNWAKKMVGRVNVMVTILS